MPALRPCRLMSSKFPTSCRHRASAVGKTSSPAGCVISPSPLMDGRQLEAASLLLSRVSLARCHPSELHLAVVAFYFLFFICAKIFVKYGGLSSCGQLQRVSVFVQLLWVRWKSGGMWKEIHFSMWQMERFIFLGFEVAKIWTNEETGSACTNWFKGISPHAQIEELFFLLLVSCCVVY